MLVNDIERLPKTETDNNEREYLLLSVARFKGYGLIRKN
jgi:hypothetical protein